jgi:hypothetical protein
MKKNRNLYHQFYKKQTKIISKIKVKLENKNRFCV